MKILDLIQTFLKFKIITSIIALAIIQVIIYKLKIKSSYLLLYLIKIYQIYILIGKNYI